MTATMSLVKQLIGLSQAHGSLAKQEAVLDKSVCDIAHAQEHIKSLETLMASYAEKTRSARKQVDALELEVREISNRETDLQQKLRSTTKPRESEAIERELSALSHERLVRERELEQVWRTLESMQVREKRNIQEQREKILETSTEIEELSKQKNAAEGVVSELREERNTLLAQLPQEWRTKYDRMLESVPDPIVAVVSNVCGSCFYAIVGKDLNQLRAGELLPCRSCYRILFMEPEKSSDEKSDG